MLYNITFEVSLNILLYKPVAENNQITLFCKENDYFFKGWRLDVSLKYFSFEEHKLIHVFMISNQLLPKYCNRVILFLSKVSFKGSIIKAHLQVCGTIDSQNLVQEN